MYMGNAISNAHNSGDPKLCSLLSCDVMSTGVTNDDLRDRISTSDQSQLTYRGECGTGAPGQYAAGGESGEEGGKRGVSALRWPRAVISRGGIRTTVGMRCMTQCRAAQKLDVAANALHVLMHDFQCLKCSLTRGDHDVCIRMSEMAKEGGEGG